jgi:AhpD family alkylhydroperoxidase
MSLNEKTIELVALVAAIGGNCIPCLDWHYKKCVELGISKEEIKEAVDMARKVKEAPIKKINKTADKLLSQNNG